MFLVSIYIMRYVTIVFLAFAFFSFNLTVYAEPAVKLTVLIEEDVYPSPNADNGAGPMWGQCSTTVSRIGDEVFMTKLVVVPDAKPLNNCRWDLLKRSADGWQLLFADTQHRTREPSPIVVFPSSREVFVSANPTLVANPETYSGPAQPQVVRFRVASAPPPGGRRLPGHHSPAIG